MTRRSDINRHTRQRGSILIVAMVIIFALASLVLTLSYSVRVQASASANAAAARQADAIVRGAEQYVMALITESRDLLHTRPESDFMQVAVGQGYFWIVRPTYGDSDQPAFGLVDESGKLDLNTVSHEMLRRLPGMTDTLAGSIVDWRDEDDDPTDSGAESIVYLSRNPPYQAKNAPFETVEELLLVEGMDRQLLYGHDPEQDDSRLVTTRSYGTERYFTDGLFDDLTVWSSQPNRSASGARRININNQQQRNNLRELLREHLGDARGDDVLNRIGQGNLVDIFDFAQRTQMTADELAMIEDDITTTNSRRLRGRINIFSASREVLLTLEDLSETDVDLLIARRAGEYAINPNSVAWVYDALADRAVGLGNRIAGQGRQFSADIVAVSGNGRAFARVRIVVDAYSESPRVVYRRNLTDHGWPLEPEILQALRSGDPQFRTMAAMRSTGVSIR